jgi:hypothetical protein
MNFYRWILAASICAGSCLLEASWADQPLEVPQSRKIVAPSGKCWAYTDAASKTTTAYKRIDGKKAKLWTISGWYRVAALASDCEHFVTGYEGVNLLPEDYSPEMIMLSFYRKGMLIRQVPLKELVEDLGKLERTASHWSWGYYMGLEHGNRYRVDTVDRGEIVFDMKTGRPLANKSPR